MKKPIVIMISGKQGSGKSTLTNKLIARLPESTELRFASVIYEIHDEARMIMKSLGILPPEGLEVKDGPLLQFLGTEWGRKTYGDNVWVKCVQSMVSQFEGDYVVISDCRFKNEFDSFPHAYRIRLECNRETRKARCSQWRENDLHQSETDLDEYLKDGLFNDVFDTGYQNSTELADLIVEKVSRDKR